jgi:hypothetical protein
MPKPKKLTGLRRQEIAHRLSPADIPPPHDREEYLLLERAAVEMAVSWGSEAAIEALRSLAATLARIQKRQSSARGRGAPKGPRVPHQAEMIRQFLFEEAMWAGAHGTRASTVMVARFLKKTGRLLAAEQTIVRRIQRERRAWDAEISISDKRTGNLLTDVAARLSRDK